MKLTAAALVDFLFVFFAGTVLVAGFSYVARPMTAAFPLMFAFITLVLAVTQFVKDAFPGVGSRLKFVEDSQKPRETNPPGGWAITRVYLWILVFVLLLPVVHYVLLTFAFVLGVVRVEGRMAWGTSLLVALGLSVFIYLQFYVFLGMRVGWFPFG